MIKTSKTATAGESWNCLSTVNYLGKHKHCITDTDYIYLFTVVSLQGYDIHQPQNIEYCVRQELSSFTVFGTIEYIVLLYVAH